MSQAITFQPPRSDDCALAQPQPVPPLPRAGGWLLAGLVLLCLAPRLIVAWNLDVICPDGLFYIPLAAAIEEGRYGAPEVRSGVGHYAYNVYPLVLSLVHPEGASWETTAKCWGVLCACLMMLPFYGWCRRQHGASAALLGGMMIAAHPMLIRWSPEVARDSTFWLLFALSLYVLWRALGEVRLRWFLAAGIVLPLAANTRFEGWFLYVTLAVWLGWRLCALRSGRRKLLLGAALVSVAYPLVFFSLMLAHGYVNWKLGGLGRLNLLVHWWQAPAASVAASAAASAHEVAAGAAAAGDSAAGAALDASLSSQAGEWGNTIVRAFMYFFGAAVLLGFCRARRIMLRPDILGLVGYSVPLLVGMWIQLGTSGLISRRYAMSLVILSAPFAAHGLYLVSRWCSRPWRARQPAVAYAALTLLLLWSAYGWHHAISHRDFGRERRAEFGRWLRQQFGPRRQLAGDGNWRLAGYYGDCDYRVFPVDRQGRPRINLAEYLSQQQPEFMVVPLTGTLQPQLDALWAQCPGLGYRKMDAGRLPASCRRRVALLVKSPLLARRPDGGARGDGAGRPP